VPRVRSWTRHFTNILFFALALYAAVYGVTYAYRLHTIVNILCAWLGVIHLFAGGGVGEYEDGGIGHADRHRQDMISLSGKEVAMSGRDAKSEKRP